MNLRKWLTGNKMDVMLERCQGLTSEERMALEIELKRSRMDRERAEALLESREPDGPSGTVMADLLSGRSLKHEPR